MNTTSAKLFFYLIFCSVFAYGQSDSNSTEEFLLACKGLGRMAEDLTKLRDKDLTPDQAFQEYLARQDPPLSVELQRRAAGITKSSYDNPKLSAEK